MNTGTPYLNRAENVFALSTIILPVFITILTYAKPVMELSIIGTTLNGPSFILYSIIVNSKFQIVSTYCAAVLWMCYRKDSAFAVQKSVNTLAYCLTIIAFTSYIFQGRLNSLGGDSITEIILANRTELIDFIKDYIVSMNPIRREAIVVFLPAALPFLARARYQQIFNNFRMKPA